MNNSENAEKMTRWMELDRPPIAVTFVEEPPPGVTSFSDEVPSACTFWIKAESGTLYASGEKHWNCPIGAMTMGFDLPSTVQKELGSLVGMMCSCGYLGEDEPEKIPSIKKQKAGIVYGAMKDFELMPDLVLLWLSPRQAMLFGEAMNKCGWTRDSPSALMGRPACAALPMAFESGTAALSAGCTGMRTFTEVGDDRMLGVLPGRRSEEFLAALGSILEANKKMAAFYQEHKARFAVASA